MKNHRRWKSCKLKIYNTIYYLSKPILVKDWLNSPATSGKAKYYQETDSELVPWGKGEKYSEKEVEIDLKLYAYKRSKHFYVTACLLDNDPTS